MSREQTARLFVAVLLPDAVREALASVVSRLREKGTNVRWVSEENLHVTLKFLGETPAGAIPDICGAIERTVTPHAPFDMRLSGLGAFPTVRKARVMWAGVGQGAAELSAIAKDTEHALANLGFEIEGRFRAHVTLGRMREPAPCDWLCGGAEDDLGDRLACRVSSVHLMQSELTPAGARYRSISSFELCGAGGEPELRETE